VRVEEALESVVRLDRNAPRPVAVGTPNASLQT